MVALVSTQGTISLCNATTGWTGDTFVLDPDIKTEGTNSVTCALTNNGNNDIYNAGTWDLSSTHLRLSINISFIAYLTASNPIQIYLHDGTNTDYVTVVASNTDYSGGWIDVIVDTALFTTVTLSTITQVGARFITSSKPRNIINTWVDNWRYSNGYSITSATTESVSFTQVATEDATNPYGVLVNIDDVLFATGELLLGSTGSANLNLVSSNEQIVFPDRLVTSALYKLKTQQGTGNTDIDIKGLVCKTVGTSGAELDISSSLNSLSVVGSTFISMGSITITPTVTTPVFSTTGFTSSGATTISIELEDCNWNTSGSITLNTGGVLTNPTVNKSTGSTAVTTSSLDDVDGGKFTKDTGTSHAVTLTGSAGEYDWNNITTGYDAGSVGNGVEVTGGSITGDESIHITATTGTFIINVIAGATVPSVSSAGAVVNVLAGQITVAVNVVDDITGLALPDARVNLITKVGHTTIINAECDANGDVSASLTYTADTDVIGWVREQNLSGTDYVAKNISGTITSSGLTISVRLSPI